MAVLLDLDTTRLDDPAIQLLVGLDGFLQLGGGTAARFRRLPLEAALKDAFPTDSSWELRS